MSSSYFPVPFNAPRQSRKLSGRCGLIPIFDGDTLLGYVNKVRMEFAKKPLCCSDESIAEIAAAVGFGDPNYFSRVFTQIIGISPTEFRKRFYQK